jgi:hypothetical protein
LIRHNGFNWVAGGRIVGCVGNDDKVLVVGSRVVRPTAVPINARVPARSKTMEFGVPGSGIAEPATGGVLLISIGTNGMAALVGGGKELAA